MLPSTLFAWCASKDVTWHILAPSYLLSRSNLFDLYFLFIFTITDLWVRARIARPHSGLPTDFRLILGRKSVAFSVGTPLLWWLWTGSDTDAWSHCDVLLETSLSIPQTFLEGWSNPPVA